MPMKFHNILCPVDFAESSQRAVRHALELAHVFSSEMMLLHVLDTHLLSAYVAGDMPGYLPGLEQVRQSAEDDMAKLLEACRKDFPDVNLRSLVVEGVPVMKIVEVAEKEGADLICIGTHGRRGIAHFLIGSVAEKVMRFVHCPVLVCKSPEQEFLHKHEIEKELGAMETSPNPKPKEGP